MNNYGIKPFDIVYTGENRDGYFDLCHTENIRNITERLEQEAETVHDFRKMLDAEILAYQILVNKTYTVEMTPEVITDTDMDIAIIGFAVLTKEDFEQETVYEIFPISYIDNAGAYIVEYRLKEKPVAFTYSF